MSPHISHCDPPLVDDELPEGDPVRRVEVLEVLRFGFAVGAPATARLVGGWVVVAAPGGDLGEPRHSCSLKSKEYIYI
jgi:hypothetical protein